MNTLIDDTRRVVYKDFGCWDSRMLIVECDDGEPVYVLNARYTQEQLKARLPHENVHDKKNHFQDERPVQELEEEADKLSKGRIRQ